MSSAGNAGAPPLLPGGTEVDKVLSDAQQATLETLSADLGALQPLTADELLQSHALTLVDGVDYDPTAALGYDLVQASALALDADEEAVLTAQGFVISERQSFPTFTHGFETIYLEDLPVYVSADAVLHAVHKSYDDMLQAIEWQALIPALGTLLNEMRGELRDAPLDAEIKADVDLYLAVARSLLSSDSQTTYAQTVAGATSADVRSLTDRGIEASGMADVDLFGVTRLVDFSQLTPRGHYTASEALQAYFRAMMWLGRIDLRIIETQPDGTQRFHRRQLEAALALRELMTQSARTSWRALDDTIAGFVGEPDNLTLPELDGLLADLGVSELAGLASLSDAEISAAIIAGGYGTQRICSHLMLNDLPVGGTLPLNRTFLLLGQRYVIDSHVFSNVVWDRVSARRMMPDPLDVAFAALGNDQALSLLEPGLRQYDYAPNLAASRRLVDEHGADYWEANLYNLWLGALRELSPSADAAVNEGLPAVASSEAWGRRLLSTQLASWAELRHDTILYAKQSYTSMAACEFPDAYVDPYPEVFGRLAQFAERGQALVEALPIDSSGWLGLRITAYFDQLRSVATTLQEMALHQRTGTPHSQAHLDFINRAVSVSQLEDCVPRYQAEGWYADLFYDREGATEFDPTIADVHTQPTDEGGAEVGRVLHVGTGGPRLMVVTVDTCAGPRAYVGLASSYFERVTEDFQRLTDDEWVVDITRATPEDVPWMQDIVVR